MELTEVGWREWVSLPDLGIDWIKAKVDTGARTSALHAFEIKPFLKGGLHFVQFCVHPIQRRRHPEILCEAPLVDKRVITSSSGQADKRYVIETPFHIGQFSWPIEITLTNRDDMGFRMLLGRQAIRHRFLVEPGKSYKFGNQKRSALINSKVTL